MKTWLTQHPVCPRHRGSRISAAGKRILQAFQLEGDHYVLAAEAAGDATFEPSLFPGLVIPLADLWLF